MLYAAACLRNGGPGAIGAWDEGCHSFGRGSPTFGPRGFAETSPAAWVEALSAAGWECSGPPAPTCTRRGGLVLSFPPYRLLQRVTLDPELGGAPLYEEEWHP